MDEVAVATDYKPGYGFFTRISDERLYERLQAKAASQNYFTDRVTSSRVTVRLSDIALVISPNSRLSLIAHVRPTRASSTGTKGFKASGPLDVDIDIEQLIASAGEVSEFEVKLGFSEPSYRPSLEAWLVIWHAIKRLRPDLLDQLNYIEKLRFDESFTFDGDGSDEQVFCEKDAVGVALDIAGIAYGGVFAELSAGRGEGKSLLRALCGNPIEDVVIAHDTHNFPEYIAGESSAHGCELRQGSRRLRIFNVNRRPGERVLGVDLIYQNLTYNAFTFIQYKMLESEGRKEMPTWRYRPDEQFQKEVLRMQAARQALAFATPSDPLRFRLAQDPFFFKLCRRQHLKVNSGQLASGLYLSLGHCELVLAAGDKAIEHGPRLGRWLCRTHFTELVAKGWVGTNNVSERELRGYVETSAASGRSLLVAVGEHRASDGSAFDD